MIRTKQGLKPQPIPKFGIDDEVKWTGNAWAPPEYEIETRYGLILGIKITKNGVLYDVLPYGDLSDKPFLTLREEYILPWNTELPQSPQ